MYWLKKTIPFIIIMLMMNIEVHARGVADNISSLQTVLDNLYEEMIPLCEDLIGIARGIAGFAALFYIATRVWRHIANAEPIDFYPLFRPFVLGFCISFFPLVIDLMRGLLKPTEIATAEMVTQSNESIKTLLALKAEALKSTRAWRMYVGASGEGDKQNWLKYTNDLDESGPKVEEGMFTSLGTDIEFAMSKAEYRFKNSVKEWMSEILNILFQAAALCINTLRTFQLVVLSIIGPLVFGLAVFDGLQHTLSAWIAKYINVYLWLPVCNIFGAILAKIQVQMLKLDLSQINSAGNTFFSASDTGYLVFMVIGIIGYFTVPSVAGFVVNAGGGGAMMSKVSSLVMSSGGGAASMAGAIGSRAMNGANNIADAGKFLREGASGDPDKQGSGVAGALGRMAGNTGYMANQLGGHLNDKKS